MRGSAGLVGGCAAAAGGDTFTFAAGACGPVGGVGGDSLGSVRPDSGGAGVGGGVGFGEFGWGVGWVRGGWGVISCGAK